MRTRATKRLYGNSREIKIPSRAERPTGDLGMTDRQYAVCYCAGLIAESKRRIAYQIARIHAAAPERGE